MPDHQIDWNSKYGKGFFEKLNSGKTIKEFQEQYEGNFNPPPFARGGLVPLPGQQEQKEIDLLRKRIEVLEEKFDNMPLVSKVIHIPTNEEIENYGRCDSKIQTVK